MSTPGESNHSEDGKEKSARVVLPAADSEEDEPHDERVEEIPQDGDMLEDYPDDTEELNLIHAKISSISELKLVRFAPYLKKLCLRQNFISILDVDVFQALKELDELDFYDNKIKHVGRALDNLGLKSLDLSFNLIKAVPDAIEHLPSLTTLYFVQNRISEISHLGKATNLVSLELGGNRIRKIENLDALVNLEELWLGKNKITKLENLDHLTKLKILSLQSNRIVQLEGLEKLVNLEQLYLSHNGVKKIEGLENNAKLNTLDLGSNFVSAIENLSHLKELSELWMNGNAIPDLHALEPELGSISTLNTLYLEGNPCQTQDMAGYRRKIMLALPQLTQIDATYVRA